jgi:hypothetical protein
MANYYWIIDKDVIDDVAGGIQGPYKATPQVTNEAKFRLLDDDENIYYYGRIFGDYEGFEPLDDFGMPNAGCVDIQYKEDGNWTSL